MKNKRFPAWVDKIHEHWLLLLEDPEKDNSVYGEQDPSGEPEYVFPGDSGITPKSQQHSHPGCFTIFLYLLLSILIALAIFDILPLHHFNLYPIDYSGLYIEHLLLIFMLISIIFIVFMVFTNYALTAFIVFLMVHIYDISRYTESNHPASDFFAYYIESVYPIIDSPFSFRSQERIHRMHSNGNTVGEVIKKAKISKEVRTYAVKAATEYFTSRQLYSDYGNYVRYFSLFTHINENFTYVPDPYLGEWIASADETLETNISGDCEDYSIFMFQCLTAISGKARIVLTHNHAYPELLAGTHVEYNTWVKPLLDNLYGYHLNYYYHTDADKKIWLSFETGDYPGQNLITQEIIKIIY